MNGNNCELVKTFQLSNSKEYEVLAEVIKDAVVEFYVYEGEETECLFTGYVKWSGCSNWDFQNKPCLLHFCSKEETVAFGTFLGKLYDWAAELIKMLTDEEVEKWQNGNIKSIHQCTGPKNKKN